MNFTLKNLLTLIEQHKEALSESFSIDVEHQQRVTIVNINCIKPICSTNPPPLTITLNSSMNSTELKGRWNVILHYLLYEESYLNSNN